jgi:hypothetical protein
MKKKNEQLYFHWSFRLVSKIEENKISKVFEPNKREVKNYKFNFSFQLELTKPSLTR